MRSNNIKFGFPFCVVGLIVLGPIILIRASSSTAREKVLVFGGNGLMGSELVAVLIDRNEYDLFLISRGNWYFDSETRIKPFVTHLVCDREGSDLEYCTELMQLISENTFRLVVDFSAYKPEVLQESVEALKGKTDLYVYISSDSIYEVCEGRAEVNGGLSRETDAVRPQTEEEQDRLNDLDEYGNEKLTGEEVRAYYKYDYGYLIFLLFQYLTNIKIQVLLLSWAYPALDLNPKCWEN
jgi:dTDP-4-dehydrorhamnose reductase